ncbi:MAG: hypothetical protein KGI29_08520, partial [Pseudomonadota bacterium]|nr:hypothetical protein [Pseudomonadota bacterium]
HYLPEQVLPLIHNFAGDDTLGDRRQALKLLAGSYLHSLEKPTRLAFSSITEMLGEARELGFSDPEINRFLLDLKRLLQPH